MKYIKTEILNNISVIILNRPEKMNAFIRDMALEMQNALDTADNEKQIRSVLITGSGKAFSAGQDLKEVTAPDGPDVKQVVEEYYNPIIKKIRNLKKPVVCAVNGVAAGAGANIALSCDIVTAASTAYFVQAFSKIGLIPDSGGTYFLPRLAGIGKAAGLMMLGEKTSPQDAEKIGLIYKVFPDAELYNKSLEIARTLAEMPTVSLWLTKKLLNESGNNTLEQQLEMETVAQQEAASTKDYKEGVEAFIQKRKPHFKGE